MNKNQNFIGYGNFIKWKMNVINFLPIVLKTTIHTEFANKSSEENTLND